jgi:hypothetical protein
VDLEQEVAIQKNNNHLLQTMEKKYKFMQKYYPQFEIKKMADALQVARSEYYAWVKRKDSMKRRMESFFSTLKPNGGIIMITKQDRRRGQVFLNRLKGSITHTD